MPETVIKLENVWKIYQLGKIDLPVLSGVSLEVKLGSFVTIMGPSGSGKSTLMYLIGLLDVPTKGKVYLDGKDVSNFSENMLAKIRGQKIGFVFQQFNLLPNLTALENVMMPMIFQGMPENERQERAKKLLASFDMEKRSHHKPNELSGGEQQRVAIARSLANDPEIIVADEPTGNLDSGTGKIIMDALTKLHKEQKKTIIVVTHDPTIADYSENIVHIRDGQIIKNHFQEAKVLW
ncbi:ABC transporter ATP-binding protein [Patescibacteria group bacterium]|nr:ABC transporter ATP-binding protein [Patescibacteria group bacterium]MBU4368079.1 ABC transporter ATP-binding protein [Patescibacteria group bacterium]MBU4462308.1 ABC transporter ATP-binding protein [Patescibacteria group bacterium]MCG2700357.1 ABC transporter ATP-binding protein [Candidatus Parcubacteria bacterium]